MVGLFVWNRIPREGGNDVERLPSSFISSFPLSAPPLLILYIQSKLLSKALELDEVGREQRTARLYVVFGRAHLVCMLLIFAVAGFVAWGHWDFGYVRAFILPMGCSMTCWLMNDRRKDSSVGYGILQKVFSTYADHSRMSGISGTQLAKENVVRNWRPFALFLRSFHFERPSANPFVIGDINEESVYEREFIRLAQKDLDLFVLSLGKDVLAGAARIQVSDDDDWKTEIFWLAAAAEVIFIWPGASDGTVWEIGICMEHFRRKSIFYCPKIDQYLATEEDKKLRSELSLMRDVLHEAGFETPTLFEQNTFWMYLDDNSLRSFSNVADSYASIKQTLPTESRRD